MSWWRLPLWPIWGSKRPKRKNCHTYITINKPNCQNSQSCPSLSHIYGIEVNGGCSVQKLSQQTTVVAPITSWWWLLFATKKKGGWRGLHSWKLTCCLMDGWGGVGWTSPRVFLPQNRLQSGKNYFGEEQTRKRFIVGGWKFRYFSQEQFCCYRNPIWIFLQCLIVLFHW